MIIFIEYNSSCMFNVNLLAKGQCSVDPTKLGWKWNLNEFLHNLTSEETTIYNYNVVNILWLQKVEVP